MWDDSEILCGARRSFTIHIRRLIIRLRPCTAPPSTYGCPGCTRGLVNGKHFVPFHRINVHLLVFHVPKETSPPVGLCVWHCVLKDSSGRILETGIVDVRTYDSKPTNKCICSFSQLLPVRLSPSSSCCSSIVARNSRFHLIMGIVRIYVMILFRIHPYPLPPRQRDDL